MGLDLLWMRKFYKVRADINTHVLSMDSTSTPAIKDQGLNQQNYTNSW